MNNQIKELQEKLKENRIPVNYENIEELRELRKSPEESAQVLLYKSKLKEANQEREKMIEYILFLENKLRTHGDNFNSTYSSNGVNDKKFSPEDMSNVNFNKSSQTNNGTFGIKSNTELANSGTFLNNNINNNETNVKNESINTKFYNNSNSYYSSFSSMPTNEEFSYILIKNLEGYEIDTEKAHQQIFKFFDYSKNNSFNSSNLTLLYNKLKELSEKLAIAIKITDIDEIELINNYLKNILDKKNNDFPALIDTLQQLVENVKLYSYDEKELIKKKLKKHLIPVYSKIISKIKSESTGFSTSNNNNSNNYITFFKLREILKDIDINLKDDYTEYLLSYMKSLIVTNNRIFNLDYTALTKIVESTDIPDDSKEMSDGSFDSKVDKAQYEERLKQILIGVNSYLVNLNAGKIGNNKISIIDIFKKESFRPQTQEGAELDICVDLNIFIEFLIAKAKITIDELDKKCIFDTYNLDEDYLVISLEMIQRDIDIIASEVAFNSSNNKIKNLQSLNVIQENDEDKLESVKKKGKSLFYYLL